MTSTTRDATWSAPLSVPRVSVADAVLVDFNHPLAGQPVTFEVQLIGVL